MLREDGHFELTHCFPSGGDTSYPGMVIHDGKLWVSYYASHEGKAVIYMASLPVEELRAAIEVYSTCDNEGAGGRDLRSDLGVRRTDDRGAAYRWNGRG